MFGEEKNLTDPKTNQNISVMDTSFSISYSKSDKLITALYMVTDIIDKGEPIRNKLRTLGAEIISDIHLIEQNHEGYIALSNISTRISEIVSFLNIASAMNFISEMNSSILKKEFMELKSSIQQYIDKKPMWLAEFSLESKSTSKNFEKQYLSAQTVIGQAKSQKEIPQTRIGVQKGSTLMKALGGVSMSDTETNPRNQDAFNLLKKQRRNDIVKIIKDNGGNVTISDIKNKAIGSLVSCGEKTLQRELVSMVKDSILKKTGEKRWSKYFLP